MKYAKRKPDWNDIALHILLGFLLLGSGTLVNHYLPQILNFETFSDAFQLSVTVLLIISSVISSILILGGLFSCTKTANKKF